MTLDLSKYKMKCYIINYSDNEIEGYQPILMEVMTILGSMMTR